MFVTGIYIHIYFGKDSLNIDIYFGKGLFSDHMQTRGRLEKQHRSDAQLSEGLASLGIMGVLMRALLKPLGPTQHYRIEGAPLLKFNSLFSNHPQ